MVSELQNYLQANLHKLRGAWVQKKSAYEADICRVLLMQQEAGRYWDARWSGYLLEFKKGTSIWLDLVRYSEVLLRLNENACREVLSLFFIPDKRKEQIAEIICVESCVIIEHLNLTEEYANMLIQLNDLVPRSLNAQASLTVNDLRRLEKFSVRQLNTFGRGRHNHVMQPTAK